MEGEQKKELERFFSKKHETFEDLKKEVAPILQENKTIYERYYLMITRLCGINLSTEYWSITGN